MVNGLMRGVGLDATEFCSQRDRGAGEARGLGEEGCAGEPHGGRMGGPHGGVDGGGAWDEYRKGRKEDGHGEVEGVDGKGDGGDEGRIRVEAWRG